MDASTDAGGDVSADAGISVDVIEDVDVKIETVIDVDVAQMKSPMSMEMEI